MIFKNLDGVLRDDTRPEAVDDELESKVRTNIGSLEASFEKLAFSDGLQSWMNAVFACNQYVDEQAPWALRKSDPDRMAAVLMTLFRCVRDLAIAVRAVVPTSSDKLLDQMGISPDERDFLALSNDDWFLSLAKRGFRISQPVGVFPRLDMTEEVAG